MVENNKDSSGQPEQGRCSASFQLPGIQSLTQQQQQQSAGPRTGGFVEGTPLENRRYMDPLPPLPQPYHRRQAQQMTAAPPPPLAQPDAYRPPVCSTSYGAVTSISGAHPQQPYYRDEAPPQQHHHHHSLPPIEAIGGMATSTTSASAPYPTTSRHRHQPYYAAANVDGRHTTSNATPALQRPRRMPSSSQLSSISPMHSPYPPGISPIPPPPPNFQHQPYISPPPLSAATTAAPAGLSGQSQITATVMQQPPQNTTPQYAQSPVHQHPFPYAHRLKEQPIPVVSAAAATGSNEPNNKKVLIQISPTPPINQNNSEGGDGDDREALAKRRKRNAESAARLRERRKTREQDLSASCTKLQSQIVRLEVELTEEKARARSDIVDKSKGKGKDAEGAFNQSENRPHSQDVAVARGAKRLHEAEPMDTDDDSIIPLADTLTSSKKQKTTTRRPLRELDQMRLDDLRGKIEKLSKLNQKVYINLGTLRQEIQRISNAIISQNKKSSKHQQS